MSTPFAPSNPRIWSRAAACLDFSQLSMKKTILLLPITLMIAACGSLPVAGPSTSKILSSGKRENTSPSGRFTLLTVNDAVLGALTDFHAGRTQGSVGASPQAPVSQKISIGDVINVTIYTTGGGLFSGGTTMTPSSPTSVGKEGSLDRDIGTQPDRRSERVHHRPLRGENQGHRQVTLRSRGRDCGTDEGNGLQSLRDRHDERPGGKRPCHRHG